MIADMILASLMLLAGLAVTAVTLLAAASAPIPGQGPNLRWPLIVGGLLILFGGVYWAHILS